MRFSTSDWLSENTTACALSGSAASASATARYSMIFASVPVIWPMIALPAWAEWRHAALREPWVIPNFEHDWPEVKRLPADAA